MKKLLIVLLALTVVGIFAFADDAENPTVTFTGRVETGVQIMFADPDPTAILHDDDSGTNGRIRLDTVAALGDYELGIGIRTDNLADFGPGMYYAGYKFLDGKIILRAGATDASTTGTVNKGWGDGINSDGGVQLIIAPIDGLQIGAMAGHLNGTSALVKDTLGKPGFGLAYAAPGFGDIRINYTAFDHLFTAGVNYTGMAGLKAQLEGYYINGADYASKKTFDTAIFGDLTSTGPTEFQGDWDYEFELFQDVAYTVGGLTPELVAYEGIAGGSALAFKVNPQVSYAATPVITLNAGVTYLSNSDNDVFFKDIDLVYDADDTYAISFSPAITFNFNKLASCLKIWYDSGDVVHTDTSDGKLEINFRSFF
jgi:hypothetical protein